MKLLALVFFIFCSQIAIAKCKEDFGTPDMFGSYEQLKHIQKEVRENDCSFIQMTWKSKTFQGAKMNRVIALDVKEGILMRARGATPGMSASWEFWHGFTKQELMEDDPSDGFDLPNYTTSFDKSKLSKKLNKVFKKFR